MPTKEEITAILKEEIVAGDYGKILGIGIAAERIAKLCKREERRNVRPLP